MNTKVWLVFTDNGQCEEPSLWNMFGLSRAEKEAAAEVDSYLEQCKTSGRKYNPQTHVNKQIKAADKVAKSRRR